MPIGKSIGYQALVLTDHETDGGVKRFISYAKTQGILTISGVEFYGMEDGLEIHLVALDYDWLEFRKNVFKGPEAMAMAQPHPPAEQVIMIVRKAGGVVGIAHPNTRMHLVEQLVGYGMNGIEVSHPSFASTGMRTGARTLEAAEKFNLYHCGGTDHTGPMNGCGGIRAIPVFDGITEEEFTVLRERRLG